MADIESALQAVHLRTQQIAAYLLWRGITPTLGVLTCQGLDETLESFLDVIDRRASEAGVRVRRLTLADTDEHTMAPRRLAQLEALPGRWALDDRFEAAARALVGLHHVDQFKALHGHSAPPHGYVADDAERFPLGAWLKRQRMGRLRTALDRLVEDDGVHAVVCPPPLPPGISMRGDLAQVLPASKDVDGVHPDTMRTLMPFRELQRDDMVLTRVATHPEAPELVRELATALLVLATAILAERQLPAVGLEGSG